MSDFRREREGGREWRRWRREGGRKGVEERGGGREGTLEVANASLILMASEPEYDH